jgi:hypothetical protein
VLQPSGCLCFAAKSFPGCLVFAVTRIQNLYSDCAVDKYMSRAINGAHATHTESGFEAVFIIQRLAQKRVDYEVPSDRGVSLQNRVVYRTNLYFSRVLFSACGAVKHI